MENSTHLSNDDKIRPKFTESPVNSFRFFLAVLVDYRFGMVVGCLGWIDRKTVRRVMLAVGECYIYIHILTNSEYTVYVLHNFAHVPVDKWK